MEEKQKSIARQCRGVNCTAMKALHRQITRMQMKIQGIDPKDIPDWLILKPELPTKAGWYYVQAKDILIIAYMSYHSMTGELVASLTPAREAPVSYIEFPEGELLFAGPIPSPVLTK